MRLPRVRAGRRRNGGPGDGRCRPNPPVTRMQSNGGARAREELAEASRAVQDAEQGIDERAYAIVKRGISLRSLEQGLVDFPQHEGWADRIG